MDSKLMDEDSIGDEPSDVGIGCAKDMLTTEHGRRTLRSVFGASFGEE